jgi:hypothetical protein
MEKSSIVAVALFAAVTLVGSSALAQDAAPAASQSPAQSQAAKKPKVWTDDNIGAVRTPADDYQMQEQQQQQAQQAAAAKAQEEAAAQARAGAAPAPKTVQQADSMIAAKKSELADQQQYLQQVQKDASNPNNSDLDNLRLDWRLKSHTASEQQTAAQLKQLEAERAALAKKEAAEKASHKSKGKDNSDSGQQ